TRSPGLRRMIHTRVRSLSERSSVPTQGLLSARSRSNSAAIAGGQDARSAWSLLFSSIVRAMVFSKIAFSRIAVLQGLPPVFSAEYRRLQAIGKSCAKRSRYRHDAKARAGRRRLDEWTVGRPDAAAARLAGGHLRAGAGRACGARR